MRVSVLFPMPLPRLYDYMAPDGMMVAPGDFVAAPLGARDMRGVVWRIVEEGAGDDVAPEKLKPLIAKFDAPPLGADIRAFVDWTANYTLFSPGEILRLVMRSGQALDPAPVKRLLAPGGGNLVKSTPARERVLAAARSGGPMTAADLARAAGCSSGVAKSLVDLGALKTVTTDAEPPFPPPDLERTGPTLTPRQHACARELKEKISAGGYSTTLIDGVTGSGKTEVYFEVIAHALAQDDGAQVLVLLPEIALTLDFIKRFERRFGAAPALWHSDMTQAQRRRVWRRAADGGVRLVAGARSALFLPYTNLRLIVVDEEHDPAYKQEDGVLYHARDLAVARGAGAGVPVILASATPSLETIANVEQGRYGRVVLPARFGGAAMPSAGAIDMKADPPERGAWMSPVLIEEVSKTLSNGEQALLFLNRRGYAPLTICRKCGHRLTAPNSDTWLVEHRYENRLVCHHTGYSTPKPKACPKCGAEDSLAACGPGVERIADEARALFPDARLAVLSSDTARSPKEAQAILRDMKEGRIDLLVGTQIVAKGHHFPKLTLVGVVDADLGLKGGDLRAGERTFQVLVQVAGRAGREKAPGRALLQTYQPEHPVIQALVSGDRERFYAEELKGREAFGFPPFGRLAAVIVTSKKREAAQEAARILASSAPRADGVDVWGPAPAPIARLRGVTRIRFLVRAERSINLQDYMRAWRGAAKLPNAARAAVDIDPYSFL